MHGQILFIKVIKKHIFCSLLSMPYFLRYFRLHHEQFVCICECTTHNETSTCRYESFELRNSCCIFYYSIMWYSHHLLISLIYKKLVAHIIVKSSIQVFPVHMNTLCAICFSRIKNLSWDKKLVASCYFQLQYSSVCLFL